MQGKIKEFLLILSNLLCICPSLFKTYLNKATCIIYLKLSKVFKKEEYNFKKKYNHQLQYF